MTDWPIQVSDRKDIYGSARELTSSDADRICHELDDCDDERVVVWMEEWLAEEKPLRRVENSRRIALAWHVCETEKAVGLHQVPPAQRPDDPDLIFVPKSQARVFENSPRVDSLSTPQKGLGDYA